MAKRGVWCDRCFPGVQRRAALRALLPPLLGGLVLFITALFFRSCIESTYDVLRGRVSFRVAADR